MTRNVIFISESVTEGHPDKICDQISDEIVDYFLTQDPYAFVRAECAVASNILFIATRFAADANIDFSRLARKVIRQIGYLQADFNPQTCSILSNPQVLPLEKRRCFDERSMSDAEIDRIPAQNQVTVFGYACNQCATLMPLPIWSANRLAQRLTELRKTNALAGFLPDGKVQVGVEYARNRPLRIHSVIFELDLVEDAPSSTKHLLRDIQEGVIAPVFQALEIKPDGHTRISLNPNGPYAGGPARHSGLTGRKNAVDTYGEYSRHSGRLRGGVELFTRSVPAGDAAGANLRQRQPRRRCADRPGGTAFRFPPGRYLEKYGPAPDAGRQPRRFFSKTGGLRAFRPNRDGSALGKHRQGSGTGGRRRIIGRTRRQPPGLFGSFLVWVGSRPRYGVSHNGDRNPNGDD